jgi:tetratricopeptide (TPR) repeat protein
MTIRLYVIVAVCSPVLLIVAHSLVALMAPSGWLEASSLPPASPPSLPQTPPPLWNNDFNRANSPNEVPIANLSLQLQSQHPLQAQNQDNEAGTLTNSGDLFANEGRFTEAEVLYKRALAINENALGPDLALVRTLNNLAVVYARQGRFADAEPLYQRVVAIREKALGSEHPDTATALNNLAAIYDEAGAYAKAEPLSERALAIFEKVLGPEHPNTAAALGNLARVYLATGAYAKAEPLYQRVVAIREKVFGPEHPDTAAALDNLAGLYLATGAYAKAEPLYQRAVAIREKVFGPEHPDTATALDNLAGLYLTRLRLRPTRYIGKSEPRIMGITGRFQWTPVEPAGTCPGYESLTLDGSEDPWTTGGCDDDSTIRGGRVA